MTLTWAVVSVMTIVLCVVDTMQYLEVWISNDLKVLLLCSHNIQLSYANPAPGRQRTICLKTGKATNRG